MLYCLVIVAMLSEDRPQKKLFAYFRESINKGELMKLDQSNYKQWIIAYSNPPVIIDCQIDQLKFVKPVFVEYLLAVENLTSRFNLFVNNLDSLTRNILLDVRDKVDVTMEQYAIPIAAVVRYKGKLPKKHGAVFGIEILVSYNASIYVHSTYTYGIVCILMGQVEYKENGNGSGNVNGKRELAKFHSVSR